jgi:hypothetical protein
MTKPLRFSEVFSEELEVVHRRRAAVGVDAAGADGERLVAFIENERFRDTVSYERPRVDGPWPPDRWPLRRDDWQEGSGGRDRPAPENLIGLALSGGGIRSAATCLGAMQALDGKDLMRRVDYLSSVSGGGYAAACLNANIAGVRYLSRTVEPVRSASGAQPGSAKDRPSQGFPTPRKGWIFPFPHVVGIRETVLFRYLRANAQYLIPRGKVLEYGFAPVLLVRGLFMNLWAMLPLVLTLSAITLALLLCPRLRHAGQAAELLGATAALLGILWAVFFAISRPVRDRLETGRHGSAWLMLFAAGLIVTTVAGGVDLAYGVIAGLIVASVTAFEWRRQVDFERQHGAWRPRAGIASRRHSVDAAAGLARESYRQAQAQALLVSAGALFLMLQPVAAAWVGAALERGQVSWQGAGTLAAAAVASTWLGRFEKLPLMVRRALLLLAAALVGPVLLWGGSLLITASIAREGGIWSHVDLGFHIPFDRASWVLAFHKSFGRDAMIIDSVLALVLAALSLWWLNRSLYKANEVSPHSHYRDKLANTFLFSANLSDHSRVRSQSELKLSAMDVRTAPFPLINAALNFVDRDEYRGRGRNSTFFTFSPCHVGSTQVDYMRTEALESVFPRFKLSSAVAISGAAASANAGRATNPALRFLLALVNVRLGYWLPNPAAVMSDRFAPNARGEYPAFPSAGAGHLLREMIGALDTESDFINLSDGGHIENLGIYELIRRRCRVIIAIDAEQDGNFSFTSLGDLVRFARIDRAVNIDIDVSVIKPDKDGISKRHVAIGRIDYGRGAYGWLIYMKSSLTGREDESVLKYRAVQKDFPHHSTGDQFFDEEQFEAYRALGYHMASEASANWR